MNYVTYIYEWPDEDTGELCCKEFDAVLVDSYTLINTADGELEITQSEQPFTIEPGGIVRNSGRVFSIGIELDDFGNSLSIDEIASMRVADFAMLVR